MTKRKVMGRQKPEPKSKPRKHQRKTLLNILSHAARQHRSTTHKVSAVQDVHHAALITLYVALQDVNSDPDDIGLLAGSKDIKTYDDALREVRAAKSEQMKHMRAAGILDTKWSEHQQADIAAVEDDPEQWVNDFRKRIGRDESDFPDRIRKNPRLGYE